MYKNLRWVVEVIPRDEEGYELPIVIPQDVPVVTAADQARIEQEMANLAFLPLPPIDDETVDETMEEEDDNSGPGPLSQTWDAALADYYWNSNNNSNRGN